MRCAAIPSGSRRIAAAASPQMYFALRDFVHLAVLQNCGGWVATAPPPQLRKAAAALAAMAGKRSANIEAKKRETK